MSTDKRFAVAGISTQAGSTKVRFANDSTRVKILIKNGHTDIELIDLPHEMTKAEIAAYMVETGFAAGRAHVESAIADLAKKNKVKVSAPESVAVATETVVAE